MSVGMGVTSVEGAWPQGVAWTRIWDIGCHWGAVNPAQGVYDWNRPDLKGSWIYTGTSQWEEIQCNAAALPLLESVLHRVASEAL